MKPPPGDANSVGYEMGYAADEFGKVLGGAFSGSGSPYDCTAIARHHWSVTQQNSDLKISIQVREKNPRRLGLFALPVLQVDFEMEKSNPEDQDHFFSRFFRYFHKGGG